MMVHHIVITGYIMASLTSIRKRCRNLSATCSCYPNLAKSLYVEFRVKQLKRELKELAEQETLRRAEHEALRRAEQEALRRAEQEAQRRAEQEAQRRAEQKAQRNFDDASNGNDFIVKLAILGMLVFSIIMFVIATK